MSFIKNWQKVKKITKMISRIHKFREVVVAELVGPLVLLLKVEYPDTMCHLQEVQSMKYSCQKSFISRGKLTSNLRKIQTIQAQVKHKKGNN